MPIQLAIHDSVVKEPGLYGPFGDALSGHHRSNRLVTRGDPIASVPLSCAPRFGGADRDRTGDLRLARAALSQLSYSPKVGRKVVGLSGFEPLTSRLSAVRSSQLSYRPVVRHQAEGVFLLRMRKGFERAHPSL